MVMHKVGRKKRNIGTQIITEADHVASSSGLLGAVQ